jgi:hypothetical protein
MKLLSLIALLAVASLPAFAQDQSSCKAYFQVVRATADSPGLRVGMDGGDKSWWDNEGQKKYPGLCLNGSVTSGDKPRYLLIWSKSKSTGQSNTSPSEIYGQSAGVLEATSPKEWIYQPRWNITSITVAYVLYDGSMEIPPVHFASNDRSAWLFPHHRKALQDAIRFLAQEPPFYPATP